MTYMQQIEISSVNEKLKLLVDFNTAAKLLKDKDYLRQYVEQLRKAGILKTSSDKENGKTKQDENSMTAIEKASNSEDENGIKKPVESDIPIKQTSSSTVTANENDALKIANQQEANKLCTVKIINEKEQQNMQSSENIELANKTPTFFIINNINKTQGAITNAQESKDRESDANDNDISSAEWSHNATLLLVSKRLEMEREFQKPILKNKLWAKISNIMKENGYNFSSSECHTKWRNMLGTYRKNVERCKQSGSGNVRWEYYNMIHEVYRKKPEVNPPEVLQVSSNANSTCSDVEDIVTTMYSPTQEKSSPCEELFSQMPSYKRKRNYEEPPEWFKEFLERREEEKRKKEELEEKRWQHFRELENKKIEVMNELTTILQKFLEK